MFPPGEAREDWTILRALSERLGKRLPYDTLGQVRARLVAANPVFAALDEQSCRRRGAAFGSRARSTPRRSRSPIADFYMTDPISRASEHHGRVHGDSRAQLAGGGAGTTATLSRFFTGYWLRPAIIIVAKILARPCRCCWRSPT